MNISVEEMQRRREMVRRSMVIAALTRSNGTYAGVCLPQQSLGPAARTAVAVVCHHGHLSVGEAIRCARGASERFVHLGEIVFMDEAQT